MDIVYKTCIKDYAFLKESLKSVYRHCKGFNKIYILSDDELPSIHRDFPEVVFIRNRWHYSGEKGQYPTLGYINQMIVKLSVFTYLPLECERAILFDSDYLIVSEFNLDKIPNIWYYNQWVDGDHKNAWKKGVDTVFNVNSEYSHMAAPGFVVTRKLLRRLREFVGVPYNTIYSRTDIPVSEFEIMGAYLRYVDPLDYTLEHSNNCPYPIKQFWTWGGKEELEKMKSSIK
jgi:hypothetical protein